MIYAILSTCCSSPYGRSPKLLSEKIHRPGSSDLNLGQRVQVSIGDPIDASTYREDERDRLMDDVRRAIAELAGEGEQAVSGK